MLVGVSCRQLIILCKYYWREVGLYCIGLELYRINCSGEWNLYWRSWILSDLVGLNKLDCMIAC